jgi:hypothetical protein
MKRSNAARQVLLHFLSFNCSRHFVMKTPQKLDWCLSIGLVNEKYGMLRISQDQLERMHFFAGIVKRSAW